MPNPRTVNIFGVVSIGLMLIMLLLIWFRLVPVSMYIPMFVLAVALFVVRVTMRIMLARQERHRSLHHKGESGSFGDQ